MLASLLSDMKGKLEMLEAITDAGWKFQEEKDLYDRRRPTREAGGSEQDEVALRPHIQLNVIGTSAPFTSHDMHDMHGMRSRPHRVLHASWQVVMF